MARCSICNKQIEPGRGILFVEASGQIKNFCGSKCRKNCQMKRRKLRWANKE